MKVAFVERDLVRRNGCSFVFVSICKAPRFWPANACALRSLPASQRIEVLIERVRATQEREVPELTRRLAEIEAFQVIGDEVRYGRIRWRCCRTRKAYDTQRKTLVVVQLT